MYVDKTENDKSTDYTTVTIRKGDKLELCLTTSEEGSLLRYTFYKNIFNVEWNNIIVTVGTFARKIMILNLVF